MQSQDLTGLTTDERRAFKRRRAAEMRKSPTPSEARLWGRLSGRQVGGVKFRQQAVLSGYIADFYAYSHKLAIEVDGGYHRRDEQRDYDARRDEALKNERGVRVLRITNEELATPALVEAAVAKIRAALKEQEACGEVKFRPRAAKAPSAAAVPAAPGKWRGKRGLRRGQKNSPPPPRERKPDGPRLTGNPLKDAQELQWWGAKQSFDRQRQEMKERDRKAAILLAEEKQRRETLENYARVKEFMRPTARRRGRRRVY